MSRDPYQGHSFRDPDRAPPEERSPWRQDGLPGARAQASGAGGPRHAGPSSARNGVLIGGAGVLAVVAIAGVIMTPTLFGGPTDPGCQAYANTALRSYDTAISDINNTAAAEGTLNAHLTKAISDLSDSAAKAKAPAAKAALGGLLAQLKTVRADFAQGSIPANAATTLNAASAAADSAC